MSFLDFYLSSNWEREREREWYIKFGYKGKMSPKLLIFFSTGFHWRIVLLSRANRLCSVFNTGLKDLGSFVSQWFFCLPPGVKWLWFVRSLRTLLKNYFSYPLLPLMGREPHFRFRVPANHLASLSLSPSGVRRPEVTKCQHLVSPVWPTFLP